MVLEYVEGGSLFAGTKISPKKRLTELSARKYFRDVLQVHFSILWIAQLQKCFKLSAGEFKIIITD